MCNCLKSAELVIDTAPPGGLYWFYFCQCRQLWILKEFTKTTEEVT
jgi:hypothetical protein